MIRFNDITIKLKTILFKFQEILNSNTEISINLIFTLIRQIDILIATYTKTLILLLYFSNQKTSKKKNNSQ